MTKEHLQIIGAAYAEGLSDGYGTAIEPEISEGELWEQARRGWCDACDDATWALLRADRHALKAAADAFADGWIAGQRLQCVPVTHPDPSAPCICGDDHDCRELGCDPECPYCS